MADLQTGVELTKLARELGVEQGELSFLDSLGADAVRDLRSDISSALFTRHEPHLHRIAALSRLLPLAMTAKIAELAMGADLCGRIAAVMEPADAVKLARQLSPAFLTDVAIALDPKRAADIVGRLPQALVVDVGRRLLERGELITLGRFVAVVSVEAALGVVAHATPADLLQVALFTEDTSALEAIVQRLDDDTLQAVVREAAETGLHLDAVALLDALSSDSCTRLLGLVSAIEPELLSGFVAAVAHHDAWPAVLPGLGALDQRLLTTLANVPETLDVDVIDSVLGHARDLDDAAVLVQAMLALDDEHVGVVAQSKALRDPAVQEWLLARSGVASRLVRAVLVELGVA